ncbi:MAG: hypothetical protein ABFS32_06350 [Bacteroidota bacterium]
MDLNRINILLERYWNCVTTVEEEEELRNFFNKQEVPEELREAATLFRYYEKQRHTSLDQKFDEEILEKITQHKSPKIRKLNLSFQNYMRVAAAVLVVLAASFVFRMEMWKGEEKPKMLLVDTYQTPEEAFEETKKAFQLIAAKMNEGRKQAQKMTIINEAEEKIKNPEK